MKVSLCIITLNEEKNLPECIESFRGCFDEVIVTDTGSSDNTAAAAKSLGAKVFQKKWNENFSDARNFCISKASGGMILWADADDRLSPGSAGLIRESALNSPDYAFTFKIKCLGHKGIGAEAEQIRMFPANQDIKFSGRVHECVSSSLMQKKIPLLKTRARVNHMEKGRDQSKRTARNKRLIELELSDNPESPRYNYYYGNILLSEKRTEDARYYFKKASNIPSGLSENISEAALCALAGIDYAGKRKKELLENTLKGLKMNKSNTLFLFYLAELCLWQKDFSTALPIYELIEKSTVSGTQIPVNLNKLKTVSNGRLREIRNYI
ncbi:MAG: glycosyltransferase [Fibrobacterota bacterium]